jgi:hypothetical protein
MDDSKARVRQMLDCAFGDLLGFLSSNFAIGMAFAAIANCRGDNGPETDGQALADRAAADNLGPRSRALRVGFIGEQIQ